MRFEKGLEVGVPGSQGRGVAGCGPDSTASFREGIPLDSHGFGKFCSPKFHSEQLADDIVLSDVLSGSCDCPVIMSGAEGVALLASSRHGQAKRVCFPSVGRRYNDDILMRCYIF